MKTLRIALVCSLLLLVAVPSFAIPCRACTGNEYPYCEPNPDGGTRCSIGIDWCNTQPSSFCTGFTDQAAVAVLAEWTVASVEVSRPSDGTKVVTTPAAVADAGLAQAAPQK